MEKRSACVYHWHSETSLLAVSQAGEEPQATSVKHILKRGTCGSRFPGALKKGQGQGASFRLRNNLWMREHIIPMGTISHGTMRSPFCVCALTLHPFSQRRGPICALCVFLDQAMRFFLPPCSSRTRCATDKAINDHPCTRYARRPDQRQGRTPSGKRALTTATDYPAPTS